MVSLFRLDVWLRYPWIYCICGGTSTVLEAGLLISGVCDALMSLHDGVSERAKAAQTQIYNHTRKILLSHLSSVLDFFVVICLDFVSLRLD